MIAPAPMRAPAKTIAWAQIVAPASMHQRPPSRPAAVEAGARRGGLPSTTPSWITHAGRRSRCRRGRRRGRRTRTSSAIRAVGDRTSPGAVGAAMRRYPSRLVSA